MEYSLQQSHEESFPGVNGKAWFALSRASLPSSSPDPSKTEGGLEAVRKEAGTKENICAKAASDTLKEAELPKSSMEAFVTPLEKEREMARKKEQERRRREAVSVGVSVEV